MSKLFSMGMFRKTIIDANLKQEVIKTHISGSTNTVKDGVSYLLIYLNVDFSRFLFLMMRCNITLVYVVLSHYM